MLKSKLLILVACSLVLSACSTSERYANIGDDDYIYVVDLKRVDAVERGLRASPGNVKAIWVNLPIKRIKKREYLASQK